MGGHSLSTHTGHHCAAGVLARGDLSGPRGEAARGRVRCARGRAEAGRVPGAGHVASHGTARTMGLVGPGGSYVASSQVVSTPFGLLSLKTKGVTAGEVWGPA